MEPVIAACSRIAGNVAGFYDFLRLHGFNAVEWTFDDDTCISESYRSSFQAARNSAGEMPVRYHAKFVDFELGHVDQGHALESLDFSKNFVDFIAGMGGTHITAHFGLGYIEENLNVSIAVKNLNTLARYAEQKNVAVCLENLFKGPTAQLGQFAEILQEADIPGVLDIGHARTFYGPSKSDREIASFLRRMKGRIAGAHLYQDEDDRKHNPLTTLEDNMAVLRQLIQAGCMWWVVELHNLEDAIKSRKILEEFLLMFRRESA